METTHFIQCPHCGHQFPVEEGLSKQAEDKVRKEFQRKFSEYKEQEAAKIRQQIETKTKEEFELKIKSLEVENEKRKKENQEMKEKEILLLRKETELREKQEQFNLEKERALLEEKAKLQQEYEIKSQQQKKKYSTIVEQEKIRAAEDARQKAEEATMLRVKDLENKLSEQRRLTEEANRKLNQESMQSQGETQELALEKLLREKFPFDNIIEVKKGQEGADVVQIVRNEYQQECGKIAFESKRTRAFSEMWISKLKDDIRRDKIEIGVVVTQVMPKDMPKFGFKDGIWICQFNEVSSVAFVLREMLLNVHRIKSSQEGKSDKMTRLYDYLTGEEFFKFIEGVVENLDSLKSDLDRERKAMTQIWKNREKQIENAISNISGMFGAMRGISGNAIRVIPSLELPYSQNKIDMI